MARDRYEISLWEDYIVAATATIPEHFEEKKVVVIGSDTMTAACRAYEPKLVENINGTNTFTFKMFYVYRDEQTGEKRQNPFLSLLVNERKVKVLWKSKWYDLVIKNIQEDSSGKSIVYTCKDLFVNELSKNGFNLEFANELENNQGTVIELGARVLEGTDWQLDDVGSDSIKQEKEEPLYIAIVNSGHSISNVHNDTQNTTGPTIGAGETIYIFYSYIQNKGTATSSKIQFLYPQTYTYVITSDTARTGDGKIYYVKEGNNYIVYTADQLEGTLYERQYTTDTNSQLIIDEDCYSATVTWSYLTIGSQPSLQYKGSRLVDSQKTVLDPVTDKYVKVYKVNSQPNNRNHGYNYYNLTKDTTRQAGVTYYTFISPNTYQEYSGTEVTGKYVVAPDEIYGYVSTEYKDPTFVNNLVVNNKNFASMEGWIGTTDNIVGPFQLYPPYSETSDIATYSAQSYLKLSAVYNDQGEKLSDGLIYNAGLRESSSYIPDGIQNGETYIFRFKAMTNNDGHPSGTYVTTGILVPHIYRYVYTNGEIIPVGRISVNATTFNNHKTDYYLYNSSTNTLTHCSNNSTYNANAIYYKIITVNDIGTSFESNADYISRSEASTVDQWVECTCTCQKSFGRNQIYSENIGLFVTTSSITWVEQVEFYQEIEGEKSVEGQLVTGRINPGEMDWTSVAQEWYHYYNHTTHQGAISLDDYIYVGTSDWSNKPLLAISNDFAKVRSITAKQSNRFNLLQTLAETFECWVQFDIQHNPETGRIIYDAGKPQKFVRFKEKIGKEVGVGFVYGIDLKTISRTIQSDQIVTKTIVSENNNEFATDGFCTIARSEENYARDTFIFNFDYYVRQLLIDGGQLNKDLYSRFQWIDKDGNTKGSTVQGYYTQLRELNLAYDKITEVLVQKKTELTKQESYKTIYENYITSLKEEQSQLEHAIMSLAGVSNWSDAQAYIKKNAEQTEIKTRMNARQNCKQNLTSYQAMLDGVNASIASLTSVLTTKQTDQKDLLSRIKELNFAFYRKYSTYIQEGSWIDENYIDDTLYYLDAQSVAYTSSRPQISYNISVARLSSLEEFKSKVFHLGDISYIQDTEFFGYVPGALVPTPYREQVLIAEVTSNFDDPIQDSFKVQNYKTQFEDLFQRITATTQSLQYSSGEYARAANTVTTNGLIKAETLQDSIAYNNNLVIQANNEQIFQDSTGITVTDATNPNKRTKITSGGVFISTDGGASWKNAIRGEGIATQYLTAGNINVENIIVLDGNYPTFRWDSTGINAYAQLKNGQGQLYGIDLSKAVRFDHYGVYGINGINGDANAYVPASEDDIWDKATFGMTWKGFFIKNKYGDHYVEISSTEDIQVVDTSGANDVVRVKIGKLNDNVYGFRLKDAAGTTTLETIADGTLWLKDKLYIGTSNGNNYQAGLGYLSLVEDVNKQIQTSVKKKTIISGEPEYDNITLNLDTQRMIFGDNEHSDTVVPLSLHRTLDIHNNSSGGSAFVVWEDGTMYAKDGYFEGTINATNGSFKGTINATDGWFSGTITAQAVLSEYARIGNTTLGQLVESAYKTVITSSAGMVFKNGSITTTLTAVLYKGATEVPTNIGTFAYQWYENNTLIAGATTNTYTLTNKVVTNTVTYDCIITYTPPTS